MAKHFLPFGKFALVMDPPWRFLSTHFFPAFLPLKTQGTSRSCAQDLPVPRGIGMLFLCQNTRHFRNRKSLSGPTYLPFLGLSEPHLSVLLPFFVLRCRNTHTTLICIFLMSSAVTTPDTNQTYILVPQSLKLTISENSSQGQWVVYNFSFHNRVERGGSKEAWLL